VYTRRTCHDWNRFCRFQFQTAFLQDHLSDRARETPPAVRCSRQAGCEKLVFREVPALLRFTLEEENPPWLSRLSHRDVAFYGPDDTTASKAAVAILYAEGAKWFLRYTEGNPSAYNSTSRDANASFFERARRFAAYPVGGLACCSRPRLSHSLSQRGHWSQLSRSGWALPAPSPTLSKLLNAPADAAATWSALQGQAVVLEFWATLVYTLRRANPAPE